MCLWEHGANKYFFLNYPDNNRVIPAALLINIIRYILGKLFVSRWEKREVIKTRKLCPAMNYKMATRPTLEPWTSWTLPLLKP